MDCAARVFVNDGELVHLNSLGKGLCRVATVANGEGRDMQKDTFIEDFTYFTSVESTRT